ncbi:MAG: alkaline phosphatase family protein [Candidatus Tumulicola sp.]
MRPSTLAALWLSAAFALGGCAGAGGAARDALPRPAFQRAFEGSGGKIAHVVVIMQENRSLDYLFQKFPGADTAAFGYGHGKKYVLQPWGLEKPFDINHEHVQFLEDYDRGKNDGFDRDIQKFAPNCPYPRNHPSCWVFFTDPTHVRLAYSFAPRSEVAPYWTMAQRFALGDRTFASNNGPSYVAHQYMIAGQSAHVTENPSAAPWGCDGAGTNVTYLLKYGSSKPPVFSPSTGIEITGPQPCFQYRTAADLLDAANVSWAYYAPSVALSGGIWSAFDAIWPVRFGADWANDVETPETLIFNDVQNGKLRQVSWVVPAFVNSDHAGSQSKLGPQWVAAIVNAIGESPYWKSTAIIVMWDEWGGWYDHVVPPQYQDPRTGAFEGLGHRIPLIVISPYAKQGYVSHRQHEVASSLHFIENTFGLPSLGGADARADALGDMFDFTQPPTPFQPIPSMRRPSDFINAKPSLVPPDE